MVYLFLGAHPDDVELGCGGLIGSAREGCVVQVFSRCLDVSPRLSGELGAAMGVLGVGAGDWFLGDWPNRGLAGFGGELRGRMEWLEERFEPSRVFVPCSADGHQDHGAVRDEALRAFKYCSVLGYVEPWNCLSEPYSLYVPLGGVAVRRKIAALRCYESQVSKTYMDPKYVEGWARHLGWKIGKEFAEGFEVLRMVVSE